MKKNSQVIIVDNFSQQAEKLRAFYEKQFINPLKTHEKRFIWDYWHVPNQYQLIRTPAYHFFPQKIYQEFHSALVQWGRENLGCHDISPPWLSYYVEGCKQHLHSDVPHGPWAFVFSLSPKQIKFKGGETLLLKPEVLNYWKNFKNEKNREESSFIEKISPQSNRLIVFDPRIPHGVTEVKGVNDPLEARLVIHGWFVEPRPYVVGGLSVERVSGVLSSYLEKLSDVLLKTSQIWGTVSLQLKVLKSGKVQLLSLLTNTLVSAENRQQDVESLLKKILKDMKNLTFEKSKKSSHIVVPLIFK